MQTPNPLPANTPTGLFARFDAWLMQRQMRATEAWLATSQSVAELESRMRDLNHNTLYRFY